MNRTAVKMTKEEVESLVEELKKHVSFENIDENESQLVIKLKDLRITIYNPKSSAPKVLPQGKEYEAFDKAYEKVTEKKLDIEEVDISEEADKSSKIYVKEGKYNEFGADEVGKESYGPFIACAVYYDNEFNKENIFEEEFADPKDTPPAKVKEIAEKLINPKNGLKYVVVAMTDVKDMQPFMKTDKGEYLHVDATYKFNDIRKRINNEPNVQAVLINEAIRILVEKYIEVDPGVNLATVISESTYDRFVPMETYYKYLNGKAGRNKVHVSEVIDETKIIENVVPTPKADSVLNSPSAAAAHIAGYYKNVFFDNVNANDGMFKVGYLDEDDKFEKINMPENAEASSEKIIFNNNEVEKNVLYGMLFIEKYGIEKFNEVTKKRKNYNPFDYTSAEETSNYYTKVIVNSLKENIITDENVSKIRKD